MAITQDSIRKSAGDGRDFGNRPPIRQSNGENTSTAGRTSSETFTQRPEDHSAVDTDFHFDQKGAIWYPDDLGSTPNAYYVKFEVYLLGSLLVRYAGIVLGRWGLMMVLNRASLRV